MHNCVANGHAALQGTNPYCHRCGENVVRETLYSEDDEYEPDTYRDHVNGHDYVITYRPYPAPQIHAADCAKCERESR